MKIVCFHLNQIGDFAFSLPALKSIRDSFPNDEIISVVRPGQREMMESTGFADKIVCRPMGMNLNKLKLAKHLASLKPDMAVVFSQSAECATLAYLSGAHERNGFVNTSLGSLLTKRIDFVHPPSTVNNLNLVEAIGGHITKRDYVGLLKPTASQIDRANKILLDNGIMPEDKVAALSPGTSGRRSIKMWTDEGFVAVGKHLVSKGLKVVVLGTESANAITKDCSGVIDLCGKTNLGEVVAILSRCRVLVAVDSGILHLCAATGTKVVGLYGPSNYKVTGPQGEGHAIITAGVQCSPCMQRKCSRGHGRICMLQIKPEDVVEAVDKILSVNN